MRVTNEEIDQLPLSQYNGEIALIDHPDQVDAAIEEMMRYKVLGFDTETRPAFTRGTNYRVALLQLSSEHKTWLFRLCTIGLPESLARFLENQDIVKPGLAIRDDLRGLRKWRQFAPGGFVDMQTIAASRGVDDLSLKKMAAHVLGVRVSKRQRLTNWESPTLTAGQMTYAATDSWISLLLWKAVVEDGITDSPALADIRAKSSTTSEPQDKKEENEQ